MLCRESFGEGLGGEPLRPLSGRTNSRLARSGEGNEEDDVPSSSEVDVARGRLERAAW
jgi:hypothetical protein